MQYRKDIKGNDLSVLGFGCMRFKRNGARTDMKKAEKLIMSAYYAGINYFDTAYIYPGNEVVLGEIIEKNGIRENIFIATKLPQFSCEKTEDFDVFFEEQKTRLRTDYIDFYLIHSVSSADQWVKMCNLGIEEWIDKKKASGEIRQIGFSYHGNEQDFMTLLDMYDWDFVQIQYNYVNINYQAGMTGLKKAAEKGMPVIIMEPLLGGRLVDGLPKEAIELMKESEPNSSAVSWALNWLLDQKEVTMILSGMNEMSQLEENVEIAEKSSIGMMGEKEHAVIENVIDVFDKYYKIKCTGCNYCMPCPKNINIPSLFSVYNNSFITGRNSTFMQYINAVGAIGDEPRFASDCISCQKCEKECPQHIKISQEMKKVKKRFEFPGLKTGAKAYRWMLKRRKQRS